MHPCRCIFVASSSSPAWCRTLCCDGGVILESAITKCLPVGIPHMCQPAISTAAPVATSSISAAGRGVRRNARWKFLPFLSLLRCRCGYRGRRCRRRCCSLLGCCCDGASAASRTPLPLLPFLVPPFPTTTNGQSAKFSRPQHSRVVIGVRVYPPRHT